MMYSNNEIFARFIKFGKVSTEREREKITEIIKEWNYVSIETSNIDKRYLDTINSLITDEQINSILSIQPHLKNEFIKELFDLLEKIDVNIDSSTSNLEEINLFSRYKELTTEEFVDIWQDENTYEKYMQKNNIDTNDFNIRYNNILDIEEGVVNKKKTEKELLRLKLRLNNAQSKKDEIIQNQDKNNILLSILNKTIKSLKFEINKYNNLLNEDNFEILKDDTEKAWEEQLTLKNIEERIKIIDETREHFLQELYEKIEESKELLKLLSPFVNEIGNLGRLWDMSVGNWQSVNFSLLEKYAQILKDKKEIQELAELLGKYRKAEAELEEEEFENIEIISKYKIEHSGKSELVGVTESDDLNNLLPTELALFSDLETESIFYKRFAEKKLQTFQYVNKENDFEQKTVTDKRQKEIEKDKGPFIIAVDTSGSMHGEPEFLAKVIAFAITKIAISEKRKAFLISFSTGIEKFELTDFQNSLEKLINFLQMSFHGGTDASEAVLEALKQMETENYEKADLLIISDGVFGNLSDSTLKSIEELKKKGNKFNSLMIGNSYNERALKFCNNIWQYDPNYDELKNLIHTIKTDLNNDNAT